jgi:nucleoside-diphosphate-sugar epimerase
MNNSLHTVLGASGAIGRAVINELTQLQLPVRAVERNVTHPSLETKAANLLNLQEARAAIAGSSHVYLCIGLPYRASVWTRQWPIVMQNVIDACAAAHASLIFFDNVYLYGPPPLSVPFDETHAQLPETKKGKIRKQINDLLVQAFQQGIISGVIGRSADFYGPYAVNGPLYISFLERMMKGKAPQSLYPLNVPHTYAFTGDLAKALVTLAQNSSSYGQAWHLPVGRPITLNELTDIFNQVLDTTFRTTQLPALLQQILSLFIPPIREVREMLYQFESPYVMSYEKFQRRFPDFQTTSYEEGIRIMIDSFRHSPAPKKNV